MHGAVVPVDRGPGVGGEPGRCRQGRPTGLALVPIAMALGEPGNEIQAPMALVILGGLGSSTFLCMVTLPVLYRRFGRA